jgi:hypothetical protein
LENFVIFPYIGHSNPNWLSYFSEGYVNHQPDQSFDCFGVPPFSNTDGWFTCHKPLRNGDNWNIHQEMWVLGWLLLDTVIYPASMGIEDYRSDSFIAVGFY